MQYYKKIDIDFYDEIVADALSYIRDQKPNIYHRSINATYNVLDLEEFKKFCPKLDLGFARYNLTCTYAVAFVMYTTSHVGVHIDNYQSGDARINIPLLNTAGSYTRFFTGGVFKETVNPETSIPALILKSIDNLKLVDKVEIDGPTVMRVNEPHDILMNMNTVPRITLTLGFDRDPIFLLED